MELVTVIMPAYNAEKYIEQSILSIVKQDYENWELVIVNDASTDNTKSIITKYVELFPDKIYMYENEKNCGPAVALNKAMENSHGEYMCWLSADDMYFETMISSSIEFMHKHCNFDAVFSKHIYVDENNELVEMWGPEEYMNQLAKEGSVLHYTMLLLEGNVFHGCSFFGKRECWMKTGKFNPDAVYATDYEYWLRMAAVTRIGFLNEYNVIGRNHPEQGTKKGENEIYAIRAFCELRKNENVMKGLFEKIGIPFSKDGIKQCFLRRINLYMDRDKELLEVLKGFQDYLEECLEECLDE